MSEGIRKNYLTFHILYLLLFIFQLNIIEPVYADNLQIKVSSGNIQKQCGNCNCIFFITHPKIENIKNQFISNKINSFLKSEFLAEKNGKCGDFEQYDSYTENVNYNVMLAEKDILSILYKNTGYLKESAHPQNISKGFNFSLKTGNIIYFKDIFTKKNKDIKKLNKLVGKKLLEYKIDPEILNYKDTYDFYLTKKNLVIINLFDSYALQGIEIKIKYSEISDIIDKNGILESILNKK